MECKDCYKKAIEGEEYCQDHYEDPLLDDPAYSAFNDDMQNWIDSFTS